MFDELGDLYREVILDHSKNPRNFKALENANRVAQGKNPLCGDTYTVYALVENDIVKDISFQGGGCAISKASASIMTEAVKGKTTAEAEKLFDGFHGLIMNGKDNGGLGKLAAFGGVNKFPARVKCAILSWHAALATLKDTSEGEKVVSTE